jgi:hypothetical protein
MKQSLGIWLKKLVHKPYEYQVLMKNGLVLTVTSLNSEKMQLIKAAYEQYIDALNKEPNQLRFARVNGQPYLTFKDRWFSAMQIQIHRISFYAVYYNDDLDQAILLLGLSEPKAAFKHARVFYVKEQLFSKEATTLFVRSIQNDIPPEVACLLYG